jgi:hypothetical protein
LFVEYQTLLAPLHLYSHDAVAMLFLLLALSTSVFMGFPDSTARLVDAL